MVSESLKHKPVILITGTSRGIGQSLALHYLKKEYSVIGCSRSSNKMIVDSNYRHFVLDITDEEQVVEMFNEIKEAYLSLNYLINNSGVNYANSIALLTSMASAKATLLTNVLGTFLMTREAAKLMIRNRFGRVINFGSMATRHEVEGEAIYTASKSAIHSLTRVMAKELNPFGITCNVISPSAIESDLMAAVDPAKLQLVLDRNAIHKTGTVEEIAKITDFIFSENASSITGQNIFLGGA